MLASREALGVPSQSPLCPDRRQRNEYHRCERGCRHTGPLEADITAPCVCMRVWCPHVRTCTYTGMHTGTHLLMQMESHSSPEHLPRGLRLFPHSGTCLLVHLFIHSFIHSFTLQTLLLHPLCASAGAGPWGGRDERDWAIGRGAGAERVPQAPPAALGGGLSAQQAKG